MGKVPQSGKRSGAGHGPGVTAPVYRPFAGMQEGEPVDAAGEFEFRGALHGGEWSCVLRVLHRPSNTERALKVMHPELVASDALQRAFVTEVERAVTMAGEVPVKVLGAGSFHTPGGVGQAAWWAMTMEWLAGRSVRELLAGGTQAGGLSLGGLVERAGEGTTSPRSSLVAEQALGYAERLAEGVAELHRVGLLHLDLKPEHLLLGRGNALRLIGHGLPVELRRRGDEQLGVRWRASVYAPPEVALGLWDELSPASDVYQLGVVTYELFAGVPCSPWVGYEELCERVDYLPAGLDELIQDCLASPAKRPPSAEIFLGRLREVTRAFEVNVHHNRPRPERKAKEIWTRAQSLADGETPPWGYVVGMCSRLLEEKPHLLPFGKIPARQVRELLDRAQAHLKQARRDFLGELVKQRAWPAATALVERLRGDISVNEADELRLSLELAQLTLPQQDAHGHAEAYRRVVEVLREPQLAPAQREQASQMLEKLMLTAPSSPAPLPVPVVTDLGTLPAVERWRVESEGEITLWRVVVGPALRLGRGSWEEFGNHVDLRPTRREAAESSITLTLAQRLSRAGHLEFRVGPDGLEAFCLGTHGALVDGTALKRGERGALGEYGTFTLAQGAVAGSYRVWPAGQGIPVAVEFTITAGVGAGRRVAWVLGSLPLALLHGGENVSGRLVPTSEGWVIETEGAGMRLGTQVLAAGARVVWPEDAALRLSAACRVVRG